MSNRDKNSTRVRVRLGQRRVSVNVPLGTSARDVESIRIKMKLGLLDPKKVKTQVPTFRAHAQTWIEKADMGFSTRKKARQVLRDHILPVLGPLRLDEITPVTILDWVATLAMAPQSTGNVLSVASNVFNDAIQRCLIQVNPTAGIRRVKRKRDVLTDDPILCWSLAERDRFLAYAQDTDWRVFQVAVFTLFTGLRPSEVRGLLGDCIDWTSCTITVKRQWCTKQNKLVEYTKGRRQRIVPIPRPVLELLRDRPHSATAQVFQETVNSYGCRYLRPLMEGAGVRATTFHGLRHTFASQLYEVTKDLLLVKETLGHRNIATTDRYVKRLNAKVTGSTDGLLGTASFLNRSNATVVPIRR